jgi:hypothetical protein
MHRHSYRLAWTTLLLICCVGDSGPLQAGIVVKPRGTKPTAPVRRDITQPTFPFPLRTGPHLDFRLRFGPSETDIQRAVNQFAARSREDEVLEGTVVENPLRRPMLYANVDDIDPDETVPGDWFERINAQRGTLGRGLRGVGRIEVENIANDPTVLCVTRGTGFVVADGIVMTNRHVANAFAEGNAFQERNGRKVAAYINFAGTRTDREALRFRLKDVLYIADDDDESPDVALFRADIGSGNRFPPRLQLQLTAPSVDGYRDSFVCGYPAKPEDGSQNDFMSIKGVKRISPGQMTVKPKVRIGPLSTELTIYHNCTTAQGNSGSPIIDFSTGKVWGLHFGRFGVNQAEPIWKLLADPRISSIPEIKRMLSQQNLLAANLGPRLLVARSADFAPAPPRADAADTVVAASVPRPALFAARNGLSKASAFPSEWFAHDSREHKNIQNAVPAVGLLKISGGFEWEGSVVLIGDNQVICPFGTGAGEAFDDKLKITVDFDRVISESQSPVLQGKRSRTVKLPDGEDLNVISLSEEDGVPRRPLRLASDETMESLSEGDAVALIGFAVSAPPGDDVDQDEFNTVFELPLGVKRVCLGKITRVESGKFWHDCSTTGGCGGAAIIDLQSGDVIGLHYGYSPENGNFAIAADTVREALAR